jgi:uncharacterized RDD family membrane protein YckC
MTEILEVHDLKHENGDADAPGGLSRSVEEGPVAGETATTESTSWLRHGVRRLGAAAMDLWVVLAWGAAGGITYLILRTFGHVPTTPVASDVLGFLTLVVPVTATLAAQESSKHRATIGKRRVGFLVTATSGSQISFARSIARSSVKFLPWQLAHTGVFHMIAGSTDPIFMGLAIGAQVLVLGNLAVMLLHPEHRAVHDLVAGTKVVDSRSPNGVTTRTSGR